ncbi:MULTISPECIES: DEAD/DEAH box helicase [unclassified Polaromonas]|uniref:DEAD/DEAH box helicase n=1 Tax=unclassified Polaromonas TaxID=2638319 RepID=UPI0018CA115B|nr:MULTISPECIES: DEAD/DEAH box helicase [unclassified Polaromonas]MBG6074086.1 hypothetical protein [Polaromonas sp. CG_9.7]MBG6116079.1 hypothetical protein [Polaromonas sp. CG_9.2]MDH6186511.1 hypothetical protein [Polaromonas sp. CG_23.6]
MSYKELRATLDETDHDKSFDAFAFLGKLSSFTSLATDEDQMQLARELLIRVLDREAMFEPYSLIVQTLLRTVGLFPYLDANKSGVATLIATEAHRPDAMPKDIVFTTKQAEVYRTLMAGRNVILSAPTSFGKSLIIDAIIASDRHNNIVVVVPTLALVDETRRRLMRFRDRYKVITHLSQKPAQRNIFLHTQERVVENTQIENIDFFVIDEFYKLQIDEGQTDERAVLLNHAFYRLAKQAKQFYMLGPNINELPDGFGANYNCTFIRTDFSTVACDTHLVPAGSDASTRLKNLVPQLSGPTLVFSGSVKGARVLGKAVAEVLNKFEPSEMLQDAIEWLSKNYSPKWGLVQSLKRGVGTHHGKLPRSVAQMLVRLFNRGHLDYLVCTSTLIEGVNTAARNVVVADNKISNRKYDFFTFNNIRGRSGRMWQHFVGHVYLFNDPPQSKLEFVDVPVFTQNGNAPDALLIQLDEEDLSDIATKRMRQIWEQDFVTLETIKENAGLEPWGQINLAREITENIDQLGPMLSWCGMPNYDNLKIVFDLAWRHLGGRSGAGVNTAAQLTYRINQYRSQPSYTAQLREAIKGKSGDEADEALETFLEFARQWVNFKAPRLMGAVNRIQAEVLRRHSYTPGDYAFFCGQLESMFMSPVITALEEYGVPIQLGERLMPILGAPDTLDDALAALAKRWPEDIVGISRFERALIRPLCRTDVPDQISVT